jgi:hypothetical protein
LCADSDDSLMSVTNGVLGWDVCVSAKSIMQVELWAAFVPM